MKGAPRILLAAALACAAGCAKEPEFDPDDLAVGPGGMVGNGAPVTNGLFSGGNDVLPAARAVAPPDDTRPPDCDAECIAFCDAAGLQNPVNRGLCRSLWGVGLSPRPIAHDEACRRMFVDLWGRFPSAEESATVCSGDWGETARRLVADDRFVAVNQRRWADAFLYSTEVVSVQSIYDMDRLVAKLMRGLVPYDLFAAVASAHPVLTRRHADARDTAEALFRTFLGRPPFENERADMARLFNVWHDGYYDHPYLNMRLPDAFLRFPCVGEDGTADPELKGECTSVVWGYHELVFEPDIRATVDPRTGEPSTWAGLLRAEEWERAQVPGRILARDLAFWEKAVGDVLLQYLGYDLAHQVPEVRQELVKYLLANQGDLRSVHFAVATSIAYLQSHEGASAAAYRWTYGPFKQLDAEVWLDSLGMLAPRGGGTCDHRITSPEEFLEAGSLSAYRVLDQSGWGFDEEGELDLRYSDAARTLGGCPENVVGGRFRVVSILTTATQLEVVADACNPALDPDVEAAAIERLLPPSMDARRAVGAEVARQIAEHQYRSLLGRAATAEELADADAAGAECALTLCDAEEFARPLCFALLSSAERIFY